MRATKKILLAATVVTAFATAPVMAADLRMPLKAPPPPAPIYSWTGCYIGGGGGYGMWVQDLNSTFFEDNTPSIPNSSSTFTTATTTAGGKGWFGTAQVGCDYQLNSDWVVGAFGDVDFGNLKGTPELPDSGLAGDERQKWTWSVGARIGYLVLPQLLAYVSGGFTEAHFDGFGLFALDCSGSCGTDLFVPSHSYHGWFLGTGYEYGLKWFPGLFWKTEYRYAQYSGVELPVVDSSGDVEFLINSKKFEQTIRSELVWRFNWSGGGPLRPGY